jgi:glycosyltransferase involved in cell wall biosynthesis
MVEGRLGEHEVKQGILYVSYDGMLEPLGQSQVLAYLEQLAPNRRIHLISFEKPQDWGEEPVRQAMRARLATSGIAWHPLRYHKAPSAPATAYDLIAGTLTAIWLARRHRLTIVHARSYVPALIGLAVKGATGAKLLFDMRGFWADERVDGGLWPDNGWLYRSTKSLERRFLLKSDHIVTLTHASETEIRRFPYLAGKALPISVIPTCADLGRFKIQGPPATDPFVLGYVGSVGTWYLLDEMLRCFRELQAIEPDAQLLIVNRGEQELIRQGANMLNIDQSRLEIVAADHRDMPSLIGRMSAGMALIKPAYSKLASAPTKLAEYLGCGVPVLGNAGVGDMAEILESRSVGVSINHITGDSIADGIRRLRSLAREPGLQQRCRQAALDLFGLDAGVAGYEEIYRALETPRPDQRASLGAA